MPPSAMINKVENTVELTDQSEGPAVEGFMKLYEESQYLVFGRLTRIAKRLLEEDLAQLHIKYELYDRGNEGCDGGNAKAPSSARRSILRRQSDRGRWYANIEEVETDMHDLAGIRVALYYPNDFHKVEDILASRFIESKQAQDWPDPSYGPQRYPSLDGRTPAQSEITGRRSRFPGYFARHYRVQLKPEDMGCDPAVKGKVLEIQVMSLLMHAWSKMHHELIYKPSEGLPKADEDDERLVDVSNGIIIAGEQIIRHIQIGLDKREAQGLLPFRTEQDFLSYLRDKISEIEGGRRSSNHISLSPSGNLDHTRQCDGLLYRSLRTYGFNTPKHVDQLVMEGIGRGRNTSKNLIIRLADSGLFEDLETEKLKLPPIKAGTRFRAQGFGRAATIRVVRYYALVINTFLRWYSFRIVINYVAMDYRCPAGDFLQILHPKTQEIDLDNGALKRIRKFCESAWDKLSDLASNDVPFSLALSRLTWYTVPSGLDGSGNQASTPDMFVFTACPKYFIDLLDGGHEGDALEEPDGYTTLLLPKETKDANGRFEWEEFVSQGDPVRASIMGLERVRSYLDRLDEMEE
ncbi:hypothetical protein SLS62_006987 [Diatrype stigma]|uniref:RelA/SpoT domain-containing protein n=1 Tax=Diatrype stigma TaxID=117547 RepID=A0AAN9UQF2_9PEZI